MFISGALALLLTAASLVADSRQSAPSPPADRRAAAAPRSVDAPALPRDYTIGADDRLAITFWGDKELDSEVVVRPDGRISLPLLNDVDAAGLTPDELRERLVAVAKQFVTEPAPTVVVKEIHSRRVFITGNVEKPGPYALNGPMTVLQLIATAGGLREFVSGKNIVIVRNDAGRQSRLSFDYQRVVKGRDIRQNIELRPGDTIIVP